MLYQKCEGLRARYPLAVQPVDDTVAEMVIMVPGDGEPEFFIAAYFGDEPRQPVWEIVPWGTDRIIAVEADGSVVVERAFTPAEAERVVTEGVPLPRDGALYGWAPDGAVTALLKFNVHSAEDHPVPTWSLLLPAGSSPGDWPPFADKRPFGPWFWAGVAAGAIVDLSDAIAKTRRMVWWAVLGDPVAGVCAVARDVGLPGDRVLPHGLFAGLGTIGGEHALPSLGDVVRMSGKDDVGALFRGQEAA